AVHTSPSDRLRLPADSGSVSPPVTPRAVHTSPSDPAQAPCRLRQRLPAGDPQGGSHLSERPARTPCRLRQRLPQGGSHLSERPAQAPCRLRQRLPTVTPRAVHTSPSDRLRLPADSGSVSPPVTPRAVHTSPSDRLRLSADSGSVSPPRLPRAVHTSPSDRLTLPADSGTVSAPVTPRAVHTSPSDRLRLPADSGSVSPPVTPRAVHTSLSDRLRLPADSGSVSPRAVHTSPRPDMAGARFMAQLPSSLSASRAQFCTPFPCVLCRVDSSRDPPAGVGELVQCDFDDNGHPFCRWTRPDAGDWMRTQGLAPGESPGPPGGTPERAGFYVTPVARAPGAVELRSLELARASVVCLEFLYYVRGRCGSWLAVLPRGPAGYGAPQWNRTGLQSSAWLRGAVTLSAPPEQPFKVVFRAARTPDFDLALDSVSIRLGPCSRTYRQTDGRPPRPLHPKSPPSPAAGHAGGWMEGGMEGRMDGRARVGMDGGRDGRKDGRAGACGDEGIDGWRAGRVWDDGGRDGRKDGRAGACGDGWRDGRKDGQAGACGDGGRDGRKMDGRARVGMDGGRDSSCLLLTPPHLLLPAPPHRGLLHLRRGGSLQLGQSVSLESRISAPRMPSAWCFTATWPASCRPEPSSGCWPGGPPAPHSPSGPVPAFRAQPGCWAPPACPPAACSPLGSSLKWCGATCPTLTWPWTMCR
ncbi:unnamed protein product, partial [Lepidochelys kempii]